MVGEPGAARPLAQLAVDRVAQQVSAVVGEPTRAVRDLVELQLGTLDAALALDAPELVADEQRWQATRLTAVSGSVTSERLDEALLLVLHEHLDADATAEVDRLFAHVLGRAADREPTGAPLVPAAQEYLAAALAGERELAVRIVRELVAGGRPAAAIMLEVLQPTQVELGRLWEAGRISVLEEHRVTATTQLCLSLLYPHLAAGERTRRSLVATAVGSEAHDLGIRMISDLMEGEGWSTAFLGANVPAPDLVLFLRHRRPDVLALSTTMARHLLDVRDLISAVRADPTAARTRILVGGRPFARHPHLAATVGADGTAQTARETLELCRTWTLGA